MERCFCNAAVVLVGSSRRLSLGELEAFSGFLAAVLLTLFYSGISGQKTVDSKKRSVLRSSFRQGAGDTVPDSTHLTDDAAAIDDDMHVESSQRFGSVERLHDHFVETEPAAAIIFNGTTVDGDIAGTGDESDSG